MQHLQLPTDEVKPEAEQRGLGRWRQTPDGSFWAAFWDGGAVVDFYGPFVRAGEPNPVVH